MDEFFTAETLASVSGCSLLVYLIVNGVRAFLGFIARWLMLAASALVNVVLFLSVDGAAFDPVSLLVLVGNIFLVAFAALGLQETTVKGVAPTRGARQTGGGRVPWRSSWLD